MNAATGMTAWTANIPGTDAYAFKVLSERLKSLLTLDQIKIMKGMGALSDTEGRRLEMAGSILDARGVDTATYKADLERIQTNLSGGGSSINLLGNNAKDPLNLFN
jgi:hypothetical protein